MRWAEAKGLPTPTAESFDVNDGAEEQGNTACYIEVSKWEQIVFIRKPLQAN